MNLSELIRHEFKLFNEDKIVSIQPLSGSGSERIYHRLFTENKTFIVAFNDNKKENQAFIHFTETFLKLGFNVPSVHYYNQSKNIYFLEDLGDKTLYNKLVEIMPAPDYQARAVAYFKKVIDKLIPIQLDAINEINFDLAFPKPEFDRESIHWDLNYFKYNFLKPARIHFDELLLERDFEKLTTKLLSYAADAFMYRDFQSRNIMRHNNDFYFIDYQGGRKGPLQYDLVSLIYQIRANLNESSRKQLTDYYINTLQKFRDIDSLGFYQSIEYFVLFRLLQVFGAYGFRGLIENKSIFLQSLIPASRLGTELLQNGRILGEYPEIRNCLKRISTQYQSYIAGDTVDNNKLRIHLTSFSYKKGIPKDYTGNGGGFVFDCRALPNPGRDPDLRMFNGMDKEIIHYFADKHEMNNFLNSCYTLVDSSIQNYLDRKFNALSISFGCTGGKHRSVYSAENMYRHIKEKYNVDIVLIHREKDTW